MNDLAYYKLLHKLHLVEVILREKLRPRLHFTWDEQPLLPLEVAKLCGQACSLLVEIGEKAIKEIDIEEAAKRTTAMGDTGSSTTRESRDFPSTPPGLGPKSKRDKRRLDDNGSSEGSLD